MDKDIITLDSDSGEENVAESNENTTATISIVKETPLDLELLHNNGFIGQNYDSSVDSTDVELSSSSTVNTNTISYSSKILHRRIRLNVASATSSSCSDLLTATSESFTQSTNKGGEVWINGNVVSQQTDQRAVSNQLNTASRKRQRETSLDSSSKRNSTNGNGIIATAEQGGSLAKSQQETYLEAQLATKVVIGDDEFDGLFKCTYNQCSKILRNNVSFMYHLWAHVVRLRPFSECEMTNREIREQRRRDEVSVEATDLLRLRTCPECLLPQTSPFRMQLHYHRVHREKPLIPFPAATVCRTCEHTYATNSMKEHNRTHGETGMPFQCRKCNYRVSCRQAFFYHFASVHLGTPLLLCPFCIKYFNITQSDRRRSIVVAKNYVEHMMTHEDGKPVSEIVASMPAIKENVSRWKPVKKLISKLPQLKSDVVLTFGCYPQCVECLQVLPSSRAQRKHYKDEQSCKFCTYKTTCQRAMQFHHFLSMCNEENAVRWPMGVGLKRYTIANSSNQTTVEDQNEYKCSTCGVSGLDASVMSMHVMQHTGVVNCGVLVSNTRENEAVKVTKAEAELRTKMIEIFGLNRMLDIDEKSKSPADLTQFLNLEADLTSPEGILKNMIHSHSVSDALKNEIIVKFVTQPLRIDLESDLKILRQVKMMHGPIKKIRYPPTIHVPWRNNKNGK